MERNQSNAGYIPALDGLRAVSISLVLSSHVIIYESISPGVLATGIHCGQTGVAVFFVLSGYLITFLLLKEDAKTGQINLRNFYVRRVLRIFPAFYFYLIVAGTLSWANFIPRVPIHDYVASLIFFRNIVGHAHETAHLWSLSLEEQFYFIWPSVMVFTKPPWRLWCGAALILLICAWRTLFVLSEHVDITGALYMRPDLRLDSLLAGCIMALARQNEALRQWIKKGLCWSGAPFVFLVSLITWIVSVQLIPAGQTVATLVTALLIAAIMNWILENPDSATGRFLSRTPLLILGRFSFSLYLWQQLFFGPNPEHRLFRSFPINLVSAFATATFSYFFVERPFLSIKRRRFGASVPTPVDLDEGNFHGASHRK